MSDAYLTIDLAAVAANWRALAAKAPAATCGAVVKADAYGLGMAEVAPVLALAGAQHFFVAQASEAVHLRPILGPEPVIWVFAGLTPGTEAALKAANARPFLNSPEQVAAFRAGFGDHPCGLQIDSGMHRLGLSPQDLATLFVDDLNLQLAMSHLACADTPDHPMNAAQLQQFTDLTARLGAVPRSLAATGGSLMGADYHFDLIRPGIGLYGGLPFEQARSVVTLTLPVIQTRTVAPGGTVGYGAAWVAQRPSRIATISSGYADGLIRAMGGQAQVYVDGTPCPIVGRVSMDLITVDVTDLPADPDEVDILGPHQSIDTLAMAAGTIGYEILTALGARYARGYTGR